MRSIVADQYSPRCYRSTNQQDFGAALGITRYIALPIPSSRFIFSYLVDLYDASITAIASKAISERRLNFYRSASENSCETSFFKLHVRSHFYQLTLVWCAFKSILLNTGNCAYF